MLSSFFKKNDLKIYTPVMGNIIPLEEVPDPVFSEKMMGEGAAVIPKEGDIYSPVEGEIIQIASSKHAIGILTEDGSEILIHVGLDTVSLKGEGFTVTVEVGEKVRVGQRLIKVDWEFIRENGKNIVTPIVITNSHNSGKKYSFTKEKIGVPGKTIIMTAST